MFHIILVSIGWLGVVLCTLGYLLLTAKIIKAESLQFQLLNVFGGFFLMFTAIYSNDIPNAAANLLWMFIAVYALRRQFKSKKNTNKN